MPRKVSYRVSGYPLSKRNEAGATLSPELKADAIALSRDGLIATGDIGYRSVLCTKGVSTGVLYFEAEVLSTEGAVRIGFASLSAEVNGPIGMDNEGYCYGSRNGYVFHQSKRKRYGPTYGHRDIVGSLVVLKHATDGVSYMKFSKNGEDLGVAYEDIPCKELRPAASLYNGGCIALNFGPYFAFPPAETDAAHFSST